MKPKINSTWLVTLIVFFLVSLVVEAHLVLRVWPTSGETFPRSIALFWGSVDWSLPSKEGQFLTLVAAVGALGGSVHGLGSLAFWSAHWSPGREELSRWGVWYLLRPPIGLALAVVVYLLIRAGLFSPTTANAEDVNVFGVTAIAGVVGLFSERAMEKLKEIAATIFRTREATEQEVRREGQGGGQQGGGQQ